MINRRGTKRRIANQIIPLFPEHKTYIEMFFGGGGMFFQKPPAQYNIVNDLDNDVFNLFQVIRYDYEKLTELMQMMPKHQSFFDSYNHSIASGNQNLWNASQMLAEGNQMISPYFEAMEDDNVMRAARFLFVASYGLFGDNSTMKFNFASNLWEVALKKVQDVYKKLTSENNVLFMRCDFRKVLKSISSREKHDKQDSFIYADPPYLTKSKCYQAVWKLNDTVDLFDILVGSGIRFGLSEFDSPVILDLAKQYGLQVNFICERYNLGCRRNEILLTNYELEGVKEVELFGNSL